MEASERNAATPPRGVLAATFKGLEIAWAVSSLLVFVAANAPSKAELGLWVESLATPVGLLLHLLLLGALLSAGWFGWLKIARTPDEGPPHNERALPTEWVPEPHSWDPAPTPRARMTDAAVDIVEESRPEIQRGLMRDLGEDRFLAEANAIHIAADRHGILYQLDHEVFGPIMRLVRVTCPSTRRTHLLRVPMTVRSAHEAVAWTFGLTPDAYAPSIEQ